MKGRDSSFLNSLSARLSFWIISLGAIVFAAVLGTNYSLSRFLLEDYVSDLARQTAASTGHEIETIFSTVASDAESLAAVVSSADASQKQVHDIIRSFLASNRNIFGMAVAYEPRVLDADIGEYSPYFYRKDDTLAYTDLAADDYRYRNWDWHKLPKQAGTSLWAEPYLDTGGGNVIMTTYSTPMRTQTGEFAGIATADIELDWLGEIVRNIDLGESGFGYIVSAKDIVIAHPDASQNMKPLLTTLGEHVSPANWQRYINGRNRNEPMYFNGPCRVREGNCWLAAVPLADTGWRLAILLPEQELSDKINTLTMKISTIAVLGLLVLVLIVIAVTRYMTNPLGRLALATKEIGAGRLDRELPEPVHQDEIGRLTTDFNTMRLSLVRYINDLTESTAKRQKLESEIEIARDIQMSMLPGGGRTIISESRYQLFCYLEPARSVGGDLYYFQQIENELQFLLGDVSDKGVPAALFMAKSVTLYTGALNDGLTPGDALSRMNESLTQGNDACMFVTALCGTLNLDTGKLVMANAGHMNPVFKSAADSAELPVAAGLALGLNEDIEYPNVEHQLQHGQSLFMYTDGISEAFNTKREQYEEERLLAYIAGSDERDAEKLGQSVLEDVTRFVSGAEQSDDITVMVIQYG